MKTLQEIKDKIAKDEHYFDWFHLIQALGLNLEELLILEHLNNLASKLYAEQALDLAAEKAEIDQDGDIYGVNVWVDKDSILSLKDQLK